MPWMQVALWVLGIVVVDHSLGGWIRTTGNHLFPSTVLGHYPLSIGWLHWFDIVFGLGLDTYTRKSFFDDVLGTCSSLTSATDCFWCWSRRCCSALIIGGRASEMS